MTVGLRLRDARTGTSKLDIGDFTVSVVYQEEIIVQLPGRVEVPGVSPTEYGAFFIPPSYGSSVYRYMPWVKVETGSVVWTLASDGGKVPWLLIVVRYR